MAEQTYSYTLTDDFPDNAVNDQKLAAEIGASAIVTALSRIDTDGDNVYIVFKEPLSAGDKTILDGDLDNPAGGLIAAHDSTPSADGSIPVKIVQNSSKTNANLRYDGFKIAVPAAAGKARLKLDWPYTVDILAGKIHCVIDSNGDSVLSGLDKMRSYCEIGVVGLLDGAKLLNDTVLKVDKSVVDNVVPGHFIKIEMAPSVDADPFFEVVAVDKPKKEITISPGLDENKADDALIELFPFFIGAPDDLKAIHLTEASLPVHWGADTIGATELPPGKKLVLEYENSEAVAKDVHGEIGILY